MARKKSALQKNRDRINRQIRQAERRGYVFDQAFKEKVKSANVNQLSHWRGDYIYKYAKIKALNPETGEVIWVSGIRGRQLEKQEAARKAAETRKIREEEEKKRKEEEERKRREEEERKKKEAWANVIIQNIVDQLQAGNNAHRQNSVNDIADDYCDRILREINKQKSVFASKIALAERISANTDDLEQWIDRIKYDSEQNVISNAFNRVFEIISNTVGISINDEFFQALDDWNW